LLRGRCFILFADQKRAWQLFAQIDGENWLCDYGLAGMAFVFSHAFKAH